MKKSEFGKITSVDLLNALYHGIAASLIPLLALMNKGKLPQTREEWIILIGVFLTAFFGDLFKSGVTNSNGQLFRKEQK